MSRTAPRSLRYSLVAITLLAIACGSASPEQQLLTNFFRASRVRDNATLSNISAVQFNPRTEGTVQDFKIASVGAEQRRSLNIRQVVEEQAKAKAAEEEFTKRKRAYQDANMPVLRKISDAQREKKPIKGTDAEVLAAWNKLAAEELETKKHASQARARANAEMSVAVGSLTPPGQRDVDVSAMDVEMLSKDVTVNAQVKTPDGQTVPKTIVFKFQRAIGKKDGKTTEGRWIITGMNVGGATATASS